MPPVMPLRQWRLLMDVLGRPMTNPRISGSRDDALIGVPYLIGSL